jgi:hypothetical protein
LGRSEGQNGIEKSMIFKSCFLGSEGLPKNRNWKNFQIIQIWEEAKDFKKQELKISDFQIIQIEEGRTPKQELKNL